MKYVHLEKDTNKIIGWYSDDIHGTYIQSVHEEKITQEEQKDEDNNIIQEELKENVLVKDGYYDISNIPTPNIEVSDEDWQNAININANCYENGKFITKDFRTPKEILEQECKAKIAEHQAYLNGTDWITAKYNDEVITLETTTKADFLAKYQDVYSNRKNARDEINRLEQELESL